MTKNRKTTILVALLVAGAVLSGNAQQTRDGNWWRTLTPLEKSIYTRGMLDGASVGETIVLRDGLAAADSYNADVKKLFGKGNTKQISDGIEAFFQDYRNRHFPAYVAMWIAALRINGVDEKEIEKMLLLMRRHSE